jgi:hypothetical protein
MWKYVAIALHQYIWYYNTNIYETYGQIVTTDGLFSYKENTYFIFIIIQ